MSEKPDLNPIALFILFAISLFLINYYELFYIIEPVRTEEFERKASLSIYVGFNFIPKLIFCVIKWFALTSLVYCCGVVLNVNKKQAGFMKRLLGFVILFEFVFIIAKIYALIYFEFGAANYSIEYYSKFYPLTLYDSEGSGMLNYTLRYFGVFDLIYITLLAIGIKQTYSITDKSALMITLFAYIVPILFWSILIQSLGF